VNGRCILEVECRAPCVMCVCCVYVVYGGGLKREERMRVGRTDEGGMFVFLSM
jgi:hypothetical protein